MEALDALPIVLDAQSVRETRDGYLVADAKVARIGIQIYRAGELGLTDRKPDEVIRVYRPAEEVFAVDAMSSLAHRPMTMDHPSEAVTADNWKRFAIGSSGGDVTRDGETVRVPLTLMDAAAIRDVKAGKRQLSVGYTCDLVFEDGTTPEGEVYDAVQRGIRANHIAVCSAARGGPTLRIGDARRETVQPGDGDVKMPHTLIIDGLQVVEVSDSAKAAIEKLQGQLTVATQAKDAAEKSVGELTATVQAKDGEIAGLNAKLKDAEVTPERLQQLADARGKVIADAKKIAGDTLTVDGLTDVAIRRAAVSAKLGDAAKDMSDAAIEGAFSALAAAAPAGTQTQARDAAQTVITNGTVSVADATKAVTDAKAARLERFANGHRAEPKAA